jgi:PAS domain S-box-containing protein
MDLIHQWFQSNLDIVFFLYGLSFLITGVAILAQPRKESEFRLARILWLFVVYALIHAPGDFLDMWAVGKGRSETIYRFGQILTYISYPFLFEFGRRLVGLTGKVVAWWISPIIIVGIAIAAVFSVDPWATAHVLVGYFIRLPGGVMASLGFFWYYNSQKKTLESLSIKRYFYGAGISLLAWTFFCGLVRERSDFFPASWLNTETFSQTVKIPAYLFRSLCALVVAWTVPGILHIFNWETLSTVRGARAGLERQSAELVKANEQLQREIIVRRQVEEEIQQSHRRESVLNDLLRISMEDIPLEEQLKQALDQVLSIPWLPILRQGGIFLAKDGFDVLELKAHRRFPPASVCSRVPIGTCLCGRAAERSAVEFADGIDERHEIHYEGMLPHGHYCVPIVSTNGTQGIMVVYLEEGHQRDVQEEEFLLAVARTLAGIIGRKRAADALQESQDRFRNLFEHAPHCILEVDLARATPTIVRANRQAEKVYGWSSREFVSTPMHELFSSQATLELTRMVDALRAGKLISIESVNLRRGGEVFPVRISAAPSSNSQSVADQEAMPGSSKTILIVEDITVEKEHHSVEEAIAQERHRIAQDIHDGLIQNLAGLRFRARYWHRLIDTDPAQMHAELNQLQEIVGASIGEVRRSILALRPVALEEEGFFPALRQLISDSCEHRQLCPVLHVSGPEECLPLPLEATLFRVVQEALSNVGKHAQANEVQIALDLEAADAIHLVVRDDGQGFDPAFLDQAFRYGHLGLRQMQERVERAGGTLVIHSQPGQGTEVRVTLPLAGVGSVEYAADPAVDRR